MSIRIVAFDFGTTTSKAVLASARLVRNAVTGRTEIDVLPEVERPEPVFTPYQGDIIDRARLEQLVEQWLRLGERLVGNADSVAGGVIITGLAAKSGNARAIAEAVRERIGNAVVAVADNPGHESWLAFMGSSASLSAAHPEKAFLNFDIGGGTTNVALGVNKTVLSTGSYWIGARHFRFRPGTYLLEGVSSFGQKVFQELGLSASIGAVVPSAVIKKIVGFYVRQLEALAAAEAKPARVPLFLEQLRQPAVRPLRSGPRILTFSGGVGELVYGIGADEPCAVTPYGDLGVDLALAIRSSPVLSRHLQDFVPRHLGRATVSGLAFHGMEASGTTVFARDRSRLPYRDLPLLGRFSPSSNQAELNQLIRDMKNFPQGGCLQLDLRLSEEDGLRPLAQRVALALRKNSFPKGIPLIIFVRQNVGKTFGNYATEWGKLAVDLMVIDEVDCDLIGQKASFASINPSGEQNLLVSFYGGLESYA